MWVLFLIVVICIGIYVVGYMRARIAQSGMEVTVSKSSAEIRRIIEKQFGGFLWINNGASYTRKAKPGYDYTIAYDIVQGAGSATVRLWMSYGGVTGASALGKMKKICKKLQADN